MDPRKELANSPPRPRFIKTFEKTDIFNTEVPLEPY
jgi:hypothetical protein